MRTIFLTIWILMQGTLHREVDVTAFYRVFGSGSLAGINDCIRDLDSAGQASLVNAYRGAMLMKKAGLERTPKEKLNTFKSGFSLLEAEISKAPENIEFRFLRLVIQESSPEILKYKKNLQDDRNCIIRGYKHLDPFLRDFIRKYSKQSGVLTIKDLQY